MKNKLLEEIQNMIQVINENEELFHDGIDEEIIALLIKVESFIVKECN